MSEGGAFTPTRIAAEVNRRYSRELRKPIDSRLASTALRRLMAQGMVRLVQKGTAHRGGGVFAGVRRALPARG
jgi:hypothetical protein